MAGYLSPRLANFTTTIFAEMSALALATGSINLGQGFPDTDGPAEMLEAAATAMRQGHNQYPPGPGVPELRQAVADHQQRYYGLGVDPLDGVLVTSGATEAIAAALLALCDVGDEVLTFEPCYDSYPACISMAGARPKVVTLEAPHWGFDPAALEAAITPRTRLLLLNTPHNPTGKVFDPEELALLARCCIEHDLVAVTDEVYEHLVFEGAHLPLAGFPGMAERTLTISSAGKTFSLTGWKVGWASGPAPLVAAVRAAKQFLTFTTASPLQHAVAFGLRHCAAHVERAAHDLAVGRDLLCDGLESIGLATFRPAATYFATTDIASLGEDDALAFCRDLPKRCGVVAVPSSVFYEHPSAGKTFVRWAFCKRPEVLAEAVARLRALR